MKLQWVLDETEEALLKEAGDRSGWIKLADLYRPLCGPKAEGKHSETFLWKRCHALIDNGFLEVRREPNHVFVRISGKGLRYLKSIAKEE